MSGRGTRPSNTLPTLVAALATTLLAASAAATPPATHALRPDQVDDARAMLATSPTPATLRVDPLDGTLRFAIGDFDLPVPATEAGARAVIAAYPSLFRLTDPDHELALERLAANPATGWTHVAFTRRQAGLPVEGERLTFHLDPAGHLRSITGRARPTFTRPATPSISGPAARAAVTAHLGWAAPRYPRPEPRLLWSWAEGRALTLAWEVRLWVPHPTDGMTARRCTVDATSGAIIACADDLHRQTFTLQAVQGFGSMSTGEQVSVDASYIPEQGFYVLADATKALAAGNFHVTLSANGWEDTSTIWQSPYSWIAAPDTWFKDPMGVEGHFNMDRVYDYFHGTHGWTSWNGTGASLVAFVHFGQNLNNAFWYSGAQAMYFGDGDGQLFNPLTRCLDVAGHEFSHAIITSTVDLAYENQSGALNEHIADFWGAAVDAAYGGDWVQIGELCMSPQAGAPALRNLLEPWKGYNPQPAHMSDFQQLPNTAEGDNGGVHVNSGIPNRAASLMAQQAGFAAVEQLYMAFLTGLYIAPLGTFSDWATGLQAACVEVAGAGSATCSAVDAGLADVGLLEGGGGGLCPPNSSLGGDGYCYCDPDTVYDAGTNSCVPGACGDVPGTGRCTGNLLETCVSGQLVQVDCTATGKACVLDQILGAVTCQAAAPCGGVTFEGTCDGAVAKRCLNGNLQQVDCLYYGQLCGTLQPQGYVGCLAGSTCTPACAGKTCGDDGCGGTCGVCGPGEVCSDADICVYQSGVPCGQVGAYGVCAGTILAYCSGNTLSVVDCADAGLSCEHNATQTGFDCLPNPAAMDCAEWSRGGGCNGDWLVYCQNEALHRIPCGVVFQGHTCDFSRDGGGFDCRPGAAGCGDITSEGVCDGQLLQFCQDGALQQTWCPDYGASCEWADGYGNRCVQAPCVSQCQGRVCGDDGCGGSCGACAAGSTCVNYACVGDDQLEAEAHGGTPATPILAPVDDGGCAGGSDPASTPLIWLLAALSLAWTGRRAAAVVGARA